jgi:hypothetical protein
MFKKLLQSAISIFLLMGIGVAIFLYDAPEFGWSNYFVFVLMGFAFVYPVATAIIVWNQISSKNLKYFSAEAGLIASLAYIWMLGSMSQFVFLTYFFILATSLSSVLARLSMKIWSFLSSIRYHPTVHKH